MIIPDRLSCCVNCVQSVRGAIICRDDHGRTALHWAAAHGLVQDAQALLLASDGMRTTQQTMAADGISTEITQNAELPRLEVLQVLQKKMLPL